MKETITNAKLNFLSGGGEMGERIRNFDWSKTPLGNPETWEGSLKTCVRIMLTSPQPMFVWWGDDLINIYNDAYRDVLGGKHPAMLGVTGKIVWKEIWDELWTRGKTVFEKNEGTFDDALLLIMNRHGYDEETYFKFSYNPIPGTKKTTEGLFCVCTEETQRIINERALDTLRKLGAIIFTEKSLDIIYRNVAEALAHNNKDFPFAFVYKITGDATTITVAATTGIDKSQNVFPDKIDITKPTAITKYFCEAFRENKMVISEIKAEDITLPTGAWQTAPKQFIYLPVSAVGSTHPYCIISAALNPYRKFDEKYLQFCRLIGDNVSNEINKMLALEIESKRAEALAEIDRAKIVFFSNISHEFRTPITLILSPLEEILNQKKNNFNKSEKQNIEIAQRNAIRLLKLVNTLLDFSNIEKGKQQAIFSLVDLVALTKNLAANFRAVIEKAGLKFIVKADTIIQPVYVDTQMWEKIVFNLLSNAFKYTPEGKITVELLAEKDFAVLKVKDTGVGIPENEFPKMFKRFHRIQNVAGRTYEGTGIGLSLVKELVQMHHGSINFESAPNKGSVFTVKIPFGKEHLNEHYISKTEYDADEITSDIYVAEIETLLETEKKEALKTSSIKEKNIRPIVLVVDDNADMREHINSLLSNNFNVITANNGRDALHKMKETTPALVLADIMMPVLDGIGLLKELKSNKATATIPVIFLTARAGEESRIEGWESGADDYLVKPFSSKELKARINAQLKITQKRESALQDLYSLFDELPFAVAALMGEELHIEFINKYNLNVWQLKKEDVIGKPLFEVRPDIKESAEHIHKEIYKTGKHFSASEIPITIKNNGKTETRYFNTSIDPMFDEARKIVGQIATSIDVTEQVLARKKNEEIANENSKLAAIVKSSEDAIISKTLEGIITSWNPGAEKIFGYSSSEMIGQLITKLIPEDRLNEEPYIIKQISLGKIVDHFETKRLTKSGKLIDISLTISPIKDGEGKIIGASKIARNISTAKVAEEKLKVSEKKYRELTTTLEEKVASRTEQLAEKNIELQKINKELEAFNYISSHDLQEPLRKIQTFAGRIIDKEKEQLSDTAKGYFMRMQDAAKRMQILIQDLLSFSRLNTTDRIFEITDLNKIVDEVKTEFIEVIEEKNATIITGEMCEINIIPFQFRQLMLNLIGNALKFSKQNVPPRIIIKSEFITGSNSPLGSRDACHIYVTDNGIGFENHFSEKIFEVFQKLHSKDEYTGTGIGLAIAKKIVENHNGIITAESEIGKGTTFNIYLPV